MEGKILIVTMAVAVIFLFLENLFPILKFEQSFWGRASTNLSLALVNTLAAKFTIGLAWQWLWQQKSSIGLLSGCKQAWLIGGLSFLLLDGYMYFWHRLTHALPLVWRFHSIHHTERTINISTNYRFHIIETISSELPKILLIWLFGIKFNHYIIYEIAFISLGFFQHSNLFLPLSFDKVISYIIVTPNYHRVHHSQFITETNSNYASILTFWDKLFNSFCHCPEPQYIQIGLSEELGKLNYISLLLLPFKQQEGTTI